VISLQFLGGKQQKKTIYEIGVAGFNAGFFRLPFPLFG